MKYNWLSRTFPAAFASFYAQLLHFQGSFNSLSGLFQLSFKSLSKLIGKEQIIHHEKLLIEAKKMSYTESNEFGLNLRNKITVFYNSIAKKSPKTNTLIDRFLLHLQRSPHAACFSLGTDGGMGT